MKEVLILVKNRKIVSIVGVRPNFVKLAALHQTMAKSFNHIILHTGQHYDYELSKAFFDCFELPEPNYNLEVGSGCPGYQLGEMIRRLEPILLKEKPNLVLVYGDTNSTLAGALAAIYSRLRVAHVESGYRSYDRSMPEEVNRILTDHGSDLLFAPTKSTMENLKREGLQKKAYLTGDVMVDVLSDYMQIAEGKSNILKKLALQPKSYLLLTIHREKNTENLNILHKLANTFLNLKEVRIVFPLHPRTEKALRKIGILDKLTNSKNISVIPPQNYLDFIKLENNAAKIVTDSGGVQKEAYVLGVPCITLRNNTELIETIKEGWNILVADHPRKIAKAIQTFSPIDNSERKALGDGKSAVRIANLLEQNF
jgi:UDP-N-acetylglucosamine 2-epimerase